MVRDSSRATVKFTSVLSIVILVASALLSLPILYASTAPPIDIQAPDVNYFWQPFKIEIIINDPVIRQHTNLIWLFYFNVEGAEISGAHLLSGASDIFNYDAAYLKYEGASKVTIFFPTGYAIAVSEPTTKRVSAYFRWIDFVGNYGKDEAPEIWTYKVPKEDGTVDYYKFRHEIGYASRTFTIIPVGFEYTLPQRSDWKTEYIYVSDPWGGEFDFKWSKGYDAEYYYFEVGSRSINQSYIDEIVAEKAKGAREQKVLFGQLSVSTTAADSDILSYFGATYGLKLVEQYVWGYVNRTEDVVGADRSVTHYVYVQPRVRLEVDIYAYKNARLVYIHYERYFTTSDMFKMTSEEYRKWRDTTTVPSDIWEAGKQAMDKLWGEAKDVIKSFRVKPKQVEVKPASTEVKINDKVYNQLAEKTTTTTSTTETTTKTEVKPLKYTLSLQRSSRTVYNNGVFNTGTTRDSNFNVLVNVRAEGGEPNIDPYKLVYVVGRILEGENAPIGFHIEGSSTLRATLRVRPESGLAEFQVMTKGPFGPNKGLAFNPIQKIEFEAVNATTGASVSNKVIYTVNLLEAAPTILISPSQAEQVQQGAERAFKLKVLDPDNKDNPIKVRLSVNIGLIKSQGGDWSTSLYLTLKPGEEVIIGYKAPEVGNFDLPAEIDGLSMWSIQKDTTLTPLVKDAISLGLESKLNKAEQSLKSSQTIFNLKRYFGEKGVGDAYAALKAANKTYSNWKKVSNVWNGIQFIDSQTGTYTSASSDLPEGWMQAAHTQGKTTLEKVSDWGVFGINIVQTAVGVVTTVTDKIPIVGQVTGKFNLVFNVATNVWKGVLTYLGKVEKINRAEERFIPILVKISAFDDTGFEVRDGKIYLIAYFWV
ncbi:MAG: hypothetical protein QXN08_00045 [Nitrososphaerales archaeon]